MGSSLAPQRSVVPSTQQPAVAAVIITRDRIDMLRQTLTSMHASTYPISEFVVSDDSKNDSTRQFLAEEFPDVLCVSGPRRGISCNRNCGMSQVQADYILLADDDIAVDPNFVERAMALIQLGQAEMVFAPVRNQGEQIHPNAVSFLGFSTRPYRPGEPYHTANQQCFLISRELVNDCPYDEVIRAYGYEEIDFAYRVSVSGARIDMVPDAVNTHLAPDENQLYRPQQEACRMYVMYKRYAYLEHRPVRAALFAVAAFAQHLLASLKRQGFAGFHTAFKNYRNALRMLSEYRAERLVSASPPPRPAVAEPGVLMATGTDRPKFAETEASVSLDMIRGIAALVVVLGHCRYLLLADYPQVTRQSPLMAAFYLLAACGHQAVVVFFVLSGYLVGGSVLRMFRNEQWSWKEYLTRRLVRLWIVLIPGLILCYLIDGFGIRSQLAPLLYRGLVTNHVILDVVARRSPQVALGNFFFLQTILSPTFGSDGALWSLANEFWYYILFPLGLLLVYPKRSTLERATCGVLFALLVYFCGVSIVASFPIWLFGVALFFLKPPAMPGWVRTVAVVAYGLVFLLAGALSRHEGLLLDYSLGLVTTLVLYVLLSNRGRQQPSPRQFVSRHLAGFSFTLYVVHLPLAALLTAYLVGDQRWQPSAHHLSVLFGVFLLTLVYAYLVATVTELRTDRVRVHVERLLHL